MAAPKRVIDIPMDTKIADENGNITQPWMEWAITISQATRKLREGAENMDDLSFSATDGFATATDIATAWEELRGFLQEIT